MQEVFKYPLSILKATSFLNSLSCPHIKGNSSYLPPVPIFSYLQLVLHLAG